MSIYRKIIIALTGLLALLIIIAYILPQNYNVEERITINAPRELIFKSVSNLQLWENWMQWTPAKSQFIGFDGEVGAMYIFSFEKTGKGKIEINKLITNNLVGFNLFFESGKFRSKGEINLNETTSGIVVTWKIVGNLGNNPIDRYTGLYIKKYLSKDVKKGLQKLKTISEKNG